MPVPPKHPSTRARRNKDSTRAILIPVAGRAIPPMPNNRSWRPESVSWWDAVWSSPMRQEFVDADLEVITRMLMLNEAIFEAFEAGDLRLMVNLQAEMRQQEMRFGLTPIDRRRLQWTIEQGEAAEEKTTQRRKARAAKSGPKAVQSDPRELLA
jgi:hypothetical protein